MREGPVHILSLGAGVQSSTLALMAAEGEITPMPVAAVFADTQAEPDAKAPREQRLLELWAHECDGGMCGV